MVADELVRQAGPVQLSEDRHWGRSLLADCRFEGLSVQSNRRARVDQATFAAGLVTMLVTTLMLPCVAFEYGHCKCAPSANAWATSRSYIAV